METQKLFTPGEKVILTFKIIWFFIPFLLIVAFFVWLFFFYHQVSDRMVDFSISFGHTILSSFFALILLIAGARETLDFIEEIEPKRKLLEKWMDVDKRFESGMNISWFVLFVYIFLFLTSFYNIVRLILTGIIYTITYGMYLMFSIVLFLGCGKYIEWKEFTSLSNWGKLVWQKMSPIKKYET